MTLDRCLEYESGVSCARLAMRLELRIRMA